MALAGSAPASARASPALPHHSSGPGRARPAPTSAARSASLSASHRKNPAPATSRAEARPAKGNTASTELGREIARHDPPRPGRSGAPELAPAAGDPLLRRKRGRDQRVPEGAARQTRGDLVGGVATQQGIDFLEGELGVAERREPGNRQRLADTGLAVEGEAAGLRIARGAVPEHRQRAREAGEGRGGIECTSEVIGDDAHDGQGGNRLHDERKQA